MYVRMTPHFVVEEFTCHCGCGRSEVVPGLAVALERLRAVAYRSGLVVRSGFRCPEHNAAVGGAELSQHLHGTAADVDMRAALSQVLALKAFSGIGWQLVDGRKLVRHVDVRHLSEVNPTGSTVQVPAVWSYGS